jgi:hypothetical protein
MEIIDGDSTRCSRCDGVFELADVVVLERRRNKSMEKPLCESCFADVGVPKGYEVERDVTYLAR